VSGGGRSRVRWWHRRVRVTSRHARQVQEECATTSFTTGNKFVVLARVLHTRGSRRQPAATCWPPRRDDRPTDGVRRRSTDRPMDSWSQMYVDADALPPADQACIINTTHTTFIVVINDYCNPSKSMLVGGGRGRCCRASGAGKRRKGVRGVRTRALGAAPPTNHESRGRRSTAYAVRKLAKRGVQKAEERDGGRLRTCLRPSCRCRMKTGRQRSDGAGEGAEAKMTGAKNVRGQRARGPAWPSSTDTLTDPTF
jgi:hypothetical protein